MHYALYRIVLQCVSLLKSTLELTKITEGALPTVFFYIKNVENFTRDNIHGIRGFAR